MKFIKMHGLGNDFVIIDARDKERKALLPVIAKNAGKICDRNLGIGCDQLLTIEESEERLSEAFIRIYNADGSEARNCGNGLRCVSWFLMKEKGVDEIIFETVCGLSDGHLLGDNIVSVDIGEAKFNWRDIPLSSPLDSSAVDLGIAEDFGDAFVVNIGNSHAVLWVKDVDAVSLSELGPKVEHHKLFPERVNLGIVQVLSPKRLRVRVWEKGVGITKACGSGAAAAVIGSFMKGLAERDSEVKLDGGILAVEFLEDSHVIIKGEVSYVFSGQLEERLFFV